MHIRLGFELIYDCPQPTPMLLMLNVHHSRVADLVVPDQLVTDPPIPICAYHDGFGNWCSRIVAPPGRTRIASTAVVNDSGKPDPVVASARQHAVQDLPDSTLVFLLGSRYCETDRLSEVAWDLFGKVTPGWEMVQTIVAYAHHRIRFDYMSARPTKTAWDAHQEQWGVCRDYAHLAIALCRCMNIPARYCTGYMGDMDLPELVGEMDFSAWFEAYLGGRWYVFDARHNRPRRGRILMARGRDATDAALTNAFGPAILSRFNVYTDEDRLGTPG
jgi:transglutaminase-like putative cysteine protease